ncbi:MAG: helix-turn-helix domain-containing protein [Magnetococcales bacterium]|nr:helix-turn-helix domain-containing protein [Magnetococcales bacterium]
MNAIKKSYAIQLSVNVLPDGRVGTKDAAAYLGLAEKTLAIMRSKGKGPPFVKRGKVFYFIDDLDAWVQAGRAQSTAQARAAT